MLKRERGERFIAGAVCPRCGAEDRVVVSVQEERLRQRCLQCGHHEELRLAQPTETRGGEVPSEPVRIVEPPSRRR
ncbi:MAG: YheV family putative metal-binding protein [Pseudomonadales bacterium]